MGVADDVRVSVGEELLVAVAETVGVAVEVSVVESDDGVVAEGRSPREGKQGVRGRKTFVCENMQKLR